MDKSILKPIRTNDSANATNDLRSKPEMPATSRDETQPRLAIDNSARSQVAQELQSLLSDLLMAAAQAKQAHWNLRGMQFQPTHELLDDITTSVRGHSDDVAERISTLGEVPDGRIERTHRSNQLTELPDSLISVPQTLRRMADGISQITCSGRARLPALAELDPISEDLVIGVVASLEKHEWMLRSHLA